MGTVILIPAYNPDGRLLELVDALRGKHRRIVIVDDGSSVGREIFSAAEGRVERVLRHDRNRGKGAALKTGFRHLIEAAGGSGALPDVITADADGQHTPRDIAKVEEALRASPDALVLGVRSFVGKVPLRSRFGNFWTRWMFFLVTRLKVRDTQTGLRGIPGALLARVAALPGDRYEYEMAMLADARHHPKRPVEVPIATVYEPGNASSHFHPLVDSIRIYRSLFQFCLSSVLSFLIDNGLFAATVWAMARRGASRQDGILVAIVLARSVSSHFNYFYNRYVVFRREGRTSGTHRSYFAYFALVLAIATASWALTEGLSALLDANGLLITVVKIAVDTALFFASYRIQKKIVFRQ